MTQTGPHQVVISTPQGQVVVARKLYDRLGTRMQPDELGLLHSYNWWMQVSELVTGIRLTAATKKGS